jgi:sulfotransferase family protein
VTSKLPFEQRACFVAGQAKSGTTLLVALLDSHPELLVLPEETAYFPTVLTKYAPRGRRAQFEYLTKQSLSNVLFGGPCKWGKRSYETFPREKFLQTFERAAFDSATAQEDLLVLMVKAYAAALGRSLDMVTRWVEKTPANRNHVNAIVDRFPHAKILITLRDPRAILYLLRNRALAGRCETGQARPRHESSWAGRPVRTAGAGAGEDNGRSVRVSRDRFRSGHSVDADEGGSVLER